MIQEALALKIPVRIVFLTYGDNNEWAFSLYRKHPVLVPQSLRNMGLLRHDEAVAAANVLGLSADHLTFLGYPDFGTFHIWTSHWDGEKPFRSMLTKVTAVPYANAYRPGAPYKGDDILGDIESIIKEFRPTKVFVSHPGDGNPDHRALYLFTSVALWDLSKEIHPEVYPYLVHFKKWPAPKGIHPDQGLVPPIQFNGAISWSIMPLSPDRIVKKREALLAHKTQVHYNAKYLFSFIRENELFGDFSPVLVTGEESSGVLEKGENDREREIPEELTDEEKASFVGFEKRVATIEDDELVLSVTFTRALAPETAISLYVFGYRGNTPFSKMPKIHVHFGPLKHTVMDQGQRIPTNSIHVERKPTEIIVKIPLLLLGYPDRVLTSARSYLLDIPLDWVSWRILDVASPR